MPSEKLTPEEILAKGRELHAKMVYYAAHPAEYHRDQMRGMAKQKREAAKRMAKHLPEATDIQSNGKYVGVAFTRNNGERVIGSYKLIGWGYPPAAEWNPRPARRRAVPDAARENLPPAREEKPRS